MSVRMPKWMLAIVGLGLIASGERAYTQGA